MNANRFFRLFKKEGGSCWWLIPYFSVAIVISSIFGSAILYVFSEMSVYFLFPIGYVVICFGLITTMEYPWKLAKRQEKALAMYSLEHGKDVKKEIAKEWLRKGNHFTGNYKQPIIIMFGAILIFGCLNVMALGSVTQFTPFLAGNLTAVTAIWVYSVSLKAS